MFYGWQTEPFWRPRKLSLRLHLLNKAGSRLHVLRVLINPRWPETYGAQNNQFGPLRTGVCQGPLLREDANSGGRRGRWLLLPMRGAWREKVGGGCGICLVQHYTEPPPPMVFCCFKESSPQPFVSHPVWFRFCFSFLRFRFVPTDVRATLDPISVLGLGAIAKGSRIAF